MTSNRNINSLDGALMRSRWNRLFAAAAPWCVMGVMIAIAAVGMVPPPIAPADADATEFSAQRAFAHVEAIATQPRPIGSPGSAAAREYLVAALTDIGVTATLPSFTVPDYYEMRGEVSIVDIVALIEGTDSTGTIVLMAHYDTVPVTPGANDDATGVAAIIETGRALLAGPPLRNDVILLITDGEEPAPRFGSTAFVEHDPLFAAVRLVINLEAIGDSGTSELVEVAGDEGTLVSHYAAAVSRPAASSVLDDIVELIGGSNTDIAPFRDRGIAAFDFAYLRGSPIYHTSEDDIDSVHLGSLQHHGTHLLGLAQRFGNIDLDLLGGDSQEIFFTLAGRVVVHYPAWLGIALAALAGLLLSVSVWMKSRLTGRLSIRGVTVGAGSLLLVALGVGTVVAIVWRILIGLLWSTSGPLGIAAFAWMVGLAAIAIGSTVPFHRRITRRLGSTEIEWAAVTLWWVLAMAVSVLMPGTGYLFVWPVLAAVGIDALQPKRRWTALAIVAAPALVLTFPAIDTLFQTSLPRPGNLDSQIPEVAMFVGFLISLLVALLAPHVRNGRRTPSTAHAGGSEAIPR